MKTIFKVLLVLAVIGLAYVATQSILGPIRFKHEKTAREKLIIAKLMDIRKAQVAYKSVHQYHAASFSELTNWLQNGKIPAVRKEGELTEKQLESGMTEEKAVAIVNKAKATGKWDEAEKEGLSRVINGVRQSFTRDTTWVNAAENLFPAGYAVQDLGLVPGTSATFDMDTASVATASGFDIKVFQAAVPYTTYLGDLDKMEVDNLVDFATKLNRYPGLKVGSLTEVNNNAGNWE